MPRARAPIKRGSKPRANGNYPSFILAIILDLILPEMVKNKKALIPSRYISAY